MVFGFFCFILSIFINRQNDLKESVLIKHVASGRQMGLPQHFFRSKSFCEVCMKKLTFHEVAPILPPLFLKYFKKNLNEIRKFRDNMEFKVDYATLPPATLGFLLIWRGSVFFIFFFFFLVQIFSMRLPLPLLFTFKNAIHDV